MVNNLYLNVFSWAIAIWAFYTLYQFGGPGVAGSVFLAIWANNIQLILREKEKENQKKSCYRR